MRVHEKHLGRVVLIVVSLSVMALAANAQTQTLPPGYIPCGPGGTAPPDPPHTDLRTATAVAGFASQAGGTGFNGYDLLAAVATAYGESDGFYADDITNDAHVKGDPINGCTQDFGLWQNNSVHSPAIGACPAGNQSELTPTTAANDFYCLVTKTTGIPSGFNVSNFYRCLTGIDFYYSQIIALGKKPLACTSANVDAWNNAYSVAVNAVIDHIDATPLTAIIDLNNNMSPTLQLTATVVRFDQTPLCPQGVSCPDLLWQTSDSSVANVTTSGLVLPTGIGVCTGTITTTTACTTTITVGVTSLVQSKSGSVQVTVICSGCPPYPPPPNGGGGIWIWNPNANGGAGGWVWVPYGGGQNTPVSFSGANLSAIDPNDKAGPIGAGSGQYLPSTTPLRYAVYYSNELAATLPAQKVSITDQLDLVNDDLSTFSLGPIAVAGTLLTPPPGSVNFSYLLDLRPTMDLGVQVNGALNATTGLLTWTLQSLDPTTSQPPTDPTVGFLPPGATGSLFFTVMPKSGTATNTEIQNQATIVFDNNAPLSTQTWLNTIDNTAPTSRVTALPATETSSTFTVQWSGTDLGAGIQYYTIYVADNGAAYTAFQANTMSTSAGFTGQVGHTYSFYSIATDLVGNVEVKSATAEATTTVPANTGPVFTSLAATAFKVGVAGSFTVLTSGVPAPSIGETGTLPAGLTFVDNGNGTGTLSGAPATSGTYPLTFTGQNGIAPNATQPFVLTVDQLPAITSAASAVFQSGTASSFSITTSGFPNPALTETGALPAGVTFAANGNGTATLAGTPTVGGAYNFTVTAANGVTPNATQSFVLTVNQAPTFTNANTATFLVGTAGSFTISTNAFPVPSLTETGGLPAGVTFISNGNGTATLAGTPATSGVYTITLSANSSSGVSTQTFTLTVNQTPSLTSVNSVTLLVGSPSSFTVTTSGAPAPSITEAGSLPAGVTFTDNGNGTGTLSGTPTGGGIFTLTLTVTNGTGSGTQTFTLTVNQSPAITSANSTTLQAGVAGSFTVMTVGFPVAAISESGSLPSGVTFVNNGNGTATIAGTPTVGGVFNLTVTASNAVTPNATQSFTLTVDQTPAFSSVNGATFLVGTPGSFTVATNGFPTASLTETGVLPAGVTLVNNGNGTATLAGTPTTSGVYTITLSASSTSGVSTQTFTLTVNQTPSITSVNFATSLVGSANSFSVTTMGFPAPSLTETGTLPAGLTFTNNGNGTATLAGTPSASGVFTVSFIATNAVGSATQGFTFTVDQTPAFSSANATTFQAGAANSFTVAATGFPVVALVETGSLPAGLNFADNHNGTGTLSGIPTASGTFSISFTATNGVGTAAQSFSLNVLAAAAQISILPGSINFRNVYLISLESQNVTLKNVGTAAITLGKPSITIASGTDKDFGLLNLCPASLNPGQTCTITVAYVADDVETSLATLNIVDSATGSPQQVSLSANVINPIVGLNPLILSFGTLKVGTSAAKTETLKNIGTTPLNISSLAVTGSNSADFTAMPNCPSSLAPGASCTVSVSFMPSAKGTRSAGLSFTDNARTKTQTIPLVGDGK